jgi:hypothetical protein
LLINIFGYLSGQAKDFRCLMLTCRYFHSLLSKHGRVIVQAVASCTTQTEKIILFNLDKIKAQWSPFAWLETGYHLSDTIDSLLSRLESAGALQDENHILRSGTTNREPSTLGEC